MLSPVAEVSNISGIPSSAGSGIRPAAAIERRAALAMILAPGPHPAGEREVGDFLRIAEQRRLDLGQLVLSLQNAKINWAILPILTPGRTLLLLAPNHVIPPMTLEAGESLTRAVLARHSDCLLAQVLVEPACLAVRDLYLALGFLEIAELIYMHVPVRRPKAIIPLPDEFYLQTYTPQTHELFAQAIRASYQESLDCPGLNGLRDIEDVILGHQAAGGMGGLSEFEPRLWRVLLHRQNNAPPQPCGVLLLCRTDPHDSMELVYIGLAPAVRRRGLGKFLVQEALIAAADENRRRITLAVDARNLPALQMYYRHGFQRIGTKVAYIKDLRVTAS